MKCAVLISFLGETIQVAWNGTPVFIRRLTKNELIEEENLPKETLLDPQAERDLVTSGSCQVLVCSAVCTHLGCIPIPYLGAYTGWVCICHGSVYDKLGRVRQGPALKNLPTINSTLYGDIICMEELKYPREPSVRFWA
jgi:ubiquinol-cytochrome c reductase iron-sulfur subunit